MDAKQKEIQEFFAHEEEKIDAKQNDINEVRNIIRHYKDFEKTLYANFHDDKKLKITMVEEGVYKVDMFVCELKISEGRCMKIRLG
jgi:hypothetical protein